MKKIILAISISFTLLLTGQVVNAKELYYVNDYNVGFTEEEYLFLSTFYWEGYQNLMTQDDYTEFKNSNIMNGEIETKKVKDYAQIITRGTTTSDTSKTLKISKSCSTNCIISIVLTWDRTPNVHSYDVIGAYLDGTSLTTIPITTVVSSNSNSRITDLKKENNGIGSSFKLPDGVGVVINQKFSVTRSGKVYASYQHATRLSTYAQSTDYTFSKNGYGRVFNFSASSRGIYDNMNGVDISL